jgi:predicted  nucleic acid-binding Zn-ribbon protein
VSWQLTAIQDDQLQVIVTGNSADRPALEKALAPVLAARAKVHDLDTQIDAKQSDIDRLAADQKRLHDNLEGLKDSPEERALARRYAGEMNTDEDQLQSLRKDQTDLEQQRKTAQLALDEAIRSLNLDQDV